MEIVINKQTYNIKYSIRSMFVFEQLSNKKFSLETMIDWYVYYYSIIIANNPECTLSFEDFVEACDNDNSIAVTIGEMVKNSLEKQNQMVKKKIIQKKTK